MRPLKDFDSTEGVAKDLGAHEMISLWVLMKDKFPL